MPCIHQSRGNAVYTANEGKKRSVLNWNQVVASKKKKGWERSYAQRTLKASILQSDYVMSGRASVV